MTITKISYHAGERFLQRVFKLKKYTKEQVKKAIKTIKEDIANIEYRNSNFILPSFPKFKCVVAYDKTLVTIIPK